MADVGDTPRSRTPGSGTLLDVGSGGKSPRWRARDARDVIPDLGPGMRIRQYELIRELGRGGMGQVFLARDTTLGRRVAIKFLTSVSPEQTDAMLLEARTTARVRHDNIVVIYEVDQHNGVPHMVLEYLEGSSLRRLLTDRGGGALRAVELITPVVRAVARAHEEGIVHRDLKPENIFVTADGDVKVLDFGIAKILASDSVVTAVNLDDQTALGTPPSLLSSNSSLVGTPQYMAPEQFSGDVDNRSDLWAVGIILFELLAGRHPLAPYTMTSLIASAMSDEPMPAIGSVVSNLPDDLERIVDRCLAKKPEDRYIDADALLSDLELLAPGRARRAQVVDESPYPGLTAFQEADAGRFFGRDHDIARITSRLRHQPLIGIVGPSGTGKSSLVRAGVVPALKGSGDSWDVHIVRPGRQPLANLAAILAPLSRPSAEDLARASAPDIHAEQRALVRRLTTEPGYLGTLMRERAVRKQASVLLFIDQFEELYTLVADAAHRRAFTACLAGAADDASSPIRVIASIRSDFIDRLGEHRDFLDEIARGLIFLQPLGRRDLREALIRPAELLGYRFENEQLTEEMLRELEATPGALPLLQFTAAQLWGARDRKNKVLTREAYASMGGVSGALASHADQVLAALPASSHRLARDIFQRLVSAERTRTIAEIAELEQLAADRTEATRVIDHLIAARLLVVQTTNASGGPTVEIVHESLIDGWPTLRRWLDEEHEDASFLQELTTAARQWDAKQRSTGLLWRGEAMDEARRWYTQRPRRLAARERAFIEEGLALARSGKRTKRLALTAAFVVLGAVATGASIAYVRVRVAEKAATENLAQAQRAQAETLAEMQARRRAEDDRTAALSDLLTQEQLLEAAKDGLLTKTQLAEINEAKRRVAESERGRAEAALEDANQKRAALAAQLQRAEAERRAAETKAQQEASSAAMTREEVLVKNDELRAALAAAKAERERAEQATARAEAARAEAERANARLQKSLAAEQARAERLERERKKITTDLK